MSLLAGVVSIRPHMVLCVHVCMLSPIRHLMAPDHSARALSDQMSPHGSRAAFIPAIIFARNNVVRTIILMIIHTNFGDFPPTFIALNFSEFASSHVVHPIPGGDVFLRALFRVIAIDARPFVSFALVPYMVRESPSHHPFLILSILILSISIPFMFLERLHRHVREIAWLAFRLVGTSHFVFGAEWHCCCCCSWDIPRAWYRITKQVFGQCSPRDINLCNFRAIATTLAAHRCARERACDDEFLARLNAAVHARWVARDVCSEIRPRDVLLAPTAI
mmetsp:Transcript_32084/g.80800  ORF Transcript_32084/g.80800 Transcript_32084/m.80800 type:complete len:277 (+) Transcript_32084:214-1044(+)